AGTSQPSVADLFGKTKKALPNSRSSRKPSGVSTAIVRQNAFLGNCKSGRQLNHQPSAAIGMINNSRLHVYPSGGGLSDVACKMTGWTTVRNASAAGMTSAATMAKITRNALRSCMNRKFKHNRV